jgi:hypothetical protein
MRTSFHYADFPTKLAVILIVIGLGFFVMFGCASLQSRATAYPHDTAKYSPPLTAFMRDAMKEVEDRAKKELGITIEDISEEKMVELAGDRAWGLMSVVSEDPPVRQLYLWNEMSPDARFETMLHEIAHTFHPWSIEKAAREVFAETVMVRVAEYYGMKGTEVRSAEYLRQYKSGFAPMHLLKVDLDEAFYAITGSGKAAQRWK